MSAHTAARKLADGYAVHYPTRNGDQVITVNGTPSGVYSATTADIAADGYRSAYKLAIVNVIPLDEYRVWAPEIGR